MELPNPSVPKTPVIGLRFSFFTPKFPIRTCNTKNPYKFQIPAHKFHGNSFIPIHFSFSTARYVHVSARLGGPTRRRNSLRKKLINDQVRRKNLISQNPSFEYPTLNLLFDNSNNTITREDLGNDSLESNSSYELGVDNKLAESESARLRKRKSKEVGESALSTRLDKWVDQYNKDTAFWGIGSGTIFTVFHDLEGNVKRVLVNGDEILKRIQVNKQDFGDPTEVNYKILYAKGLAKEMEKGGNVIPRNSSVAKFVVSRQDSGFVKAIRDVALQPEFIPVVTGFGKLIFFGLVAIWALKNLFGFGSKEQQLTELEKEMMRRKIKSRKEKEMQEKGSVEIVQEPSELPMMSTEKPKLDKLELMRNILEAKALKDKLLLMNSSSSETSSSVNLNEKIQQIRAMAREVREFEKGEESIGNQDREEKQLVNRESSSGLEKIEENKGEVVSFVGDIQHEESGQVTDIDDTAVKMPVDGSKGDDTGYITEVFSEKSSVSQSFSTSTSEISKDKQIMAKVKHSSNTPDSELPMSNDRSNTMKPRFIRSVKEAREFLAGKCNKPVEETQVHTVQENGAVPSPSSDKIYVDKMRQRMTAAKQVFEPVSLGSMSDPLPTTDNGEDLVPNIGEYIKKDDSNASEEGYEVHDLQNPRQFLNSDVDSSNDIKQPVDKGMWMEKNFHEVEPIIKKIGDGFRDNYKIARGKVNENASTDVIHFKYNKDDSELEWMKDDDLREIVFQVRENELSGRDPFYLMDAKDKVKFFKGLEKKVEKENEKLFQVHEYLHSNIENLDYGADGISLYDPPEKFIPRWKGPVLEKKPDFLNNFIEQRKAIFAGNADTSHLVNKDEQNLSLNSTEFPVNGNAVPSLSDKALGKNLRNKDHNGSKTVIEGSDGSVRAGKKSGKEYWEHTKKWSRGFLESYNAETNPEIKSVMKDIGKDLDRWITEEEIQEAADLMKKLPERNKMFMEKKINKIKREMELFGPQAVVSKYREYAEEDEEDYLWWLDLPHVLCIELFTTQNGKKEIGFYSLEMAADLELEPKPCHVIAFEGARDCQNLCYIIQAHMDMLGNGQAFIVPRPPKDAFREAKANGFGVTVIRKGELKLNVDQTLEEVEEQITEIGSKMYHDKLMKERSVDMSALMKGVFGFKSRPASTKRKRSKRMLKKPRKK